MNKQNQKNDRAVLESVRAREIVSEILDFGVTQEQIKKIIKFLSLELEDVSLMKKISLIIDDDEESDTTKPSIQI